MCLPSYTILPLSVLLFLPSDVSTVPSWHHFACSPGQEYLFSEDKKTWAEATGQCELYGSYLLSIDSYEEQICLLEMSNSLGLHQWWWHDGSYLLSIDSYEEQICLLEMSY